MKVGTSLKFDCFIEVTKPKEYLVDVDIVRRGGIHRGIYACRHIQSYTYV